jgi:hypothetical protein
MSIIQVGGNTISAANSTTALLGVSATFTGTWETVTDYTSIAVTVLGTNATDGVIWFDVRKVGSTIVNSVPFFKTDITGNATNIPSIWNIVESEFRIRYVNGTTAQLTEWYLETKYSNGQQAELLSTAGGTMNPNTPVSTTKSLTSAANPLGDYINTPASGLAFSTTALLGNGISFDSGVLNLTNYTQVQTSILSDKNGTIAISFLQDSGGADILRTLTIPYIGGSGFKMFSAPAFTPYVKYVFTCDEVGQTDFYFDTKFLITSLSGQLLGIEDFIAPGMVANLGRNVQVGKDPNGIFINNPVAGVDNNNSTESILGIAGVFTGGWSRVDLFGEIKVASTSDVESASCFLQLSHDGISVDTSLNLPPQLNAGGTWSFIHSLNPSLPYFRVVYTNGATGQTSFGLTTTLLVNSGAGFVSRTTQVIDRYTDARVIRQANDPTLDRNLGLLNYQKSARKFGKNNSVANSAFETVWSGAANGGALQYVFATSAQTIRVKAGGNAADTAAGLGTQKITVEGLDENWNAITEDIVTAGASASAATTGLFFAVNRVTSKETGAFGVANTGTIIIENTTTGTELAYMAAGIGSTEQCVYTVPLGVTAYVTKIRVSVGESDSADVRLEHIEFGDDIAGTGGTFTSVKKLEWEIEDFSGARDFELDTYLKFDEKNHIFFEAQRITGSGTAQVSVDFEMYLVDN